MLLLDVNICVHAIRPEISAESAAVGAWLDEALSGDTQIGVSDLVLAAMIRITTNPRVFKVPTSPDQGLEFASALRGAPAAVSVNPGPHHWAAFATLVAEHRLRRNDITDAYLAALALERGATFVTRDRGLRRFEKLRVLDPLA